MTDVATYAALCSGIGGLELAVESVFGLRAAWHAEIDPAAAMIHDRHWPGLPNVGDVTAADWSTVEPVELICFGFPCQDLSYAGKGAGIEEGTRSGLWHDCLRAVRVVRPRVVVVENVAALLTRRDGLDFSIVMAGLAEAGFDTEWVSLRASDVGAPHRRERVFLVAADAERPPVRALRHGQPAGTPSSSEGAGRQRQRVRADAGDGGAAVADAESEHEYRSRRARRRGTESANGRSLAPDADGGRQQERSEFDGTASQGAAYGRPRREHADRRGEPVADSTGDQGWFCDGDGVPPAHADEQGPQRPEPAGRHVMPAWGDYEPAIRRWEAILGRSAPSAVDRRGRLNPPFVEWMMGYPAGWVEPLKRTAALRCLGNAVVPQQAIAALSLLREAWEEAA